MFAQPMKLTPALIALLLSATGTALCAADATTPPKPTEPAKPAAPAKPAPKPLTPPKTPATIANLHYGDHERQVLDFYQAKSDKPTPVLFNIHGGGWMGGDKWNVAPEPYLAAGISVVSINYRYVSQAKAAGVTPPVKAPLEDAARALQFVRSHSKEWNIDKTRIAATGGSAGACSSLWLDFHSDMADPKSADPISHESTRLLCAAVNVAQTSLDPQQMKDWTPNSNYGAHAFGLSGFKEFLEKREQILPWIKQYSPYELVSKDDPPVALYYGDVPEIGHEKKDPTHTSNFGLKLQEHCKEIGVPCELFYPGCPEGKYPSVSEYLIGKLNGTAAKK